jgi:hypothetical protein
LLRRVWLGLMVKRLHGVCGRVVGMIVGRRKRPFTPTMLQKIVKTNLSILLQHCRGAGVGW